MVFDTCTIRAADGTSMDLGIISQTDTGPVGTVCTLDTAPAQVTAYRAALKTAAGGVTVAGHREFREAHIVGVFVARSRDELAILWSTFTGICRAGQLVEVRFTVAGVVRSIVGVADGAPANGRVHQLAENFTLTLVCADPAAYTLTPTTGTVASDSTVTLSNVGDANVPFVATVSGPASGTVTEVKVKNNTTGRYVDVTGITFVHGDTLVVDMTPGAERVELNGTSIVGKISTTSRWVWLVPGDNTVALTATGGTVSASLSFASGWWS